MIQTNNPEPEPSDLLYDYLYNDIGLTKEAIELGIRYSRKENAPLPIILWSFGLISVKQYKQIITWIYTSKIK